MGVLKTQRGTALQDVDGHYRPTAENFFMTISGTDVSGLSGVVDVVLIYEDIS